MTRLGTYALSAVLALSANAAASAARPSGCSKPAVSAIASLICSDDELAKLDRRLTETYAMAIRKAARQHPRLLQTDQADWIKARDACWQSADQRRCTLDRYRQRLAELQARYRLVPHTGPTRYACDGRPENGVLAYWFDTDPPTLIAQRGSEVALMYQQPAASGSRYAGRNESLWEWHGEATIVWGYQAPAMHCRVMH